MNHSEERPKPSASGRRLHRSTYVFLVFVFIGVLLANIPGQYVLDLNFTDGQYGPDFEFYVHCEHGWPFTFLRREAVMLNVPPGWRFSPWRLTEGVEQFNPPSVIANLFVGAAVVLVGGLLFEIWRRRRRRLLQFGLRELLILVTVVSVGAAAFTAQRSQHRKEQAVLRAIDETPSQKHFDWGVSQIADRTEWRERGPTWLRQLVGDPRVTVFDRVIRIYANGEELKHVVELSHLKVLCIPCPITKGQLRLLEHLPQLEALNMRFVYPVDADGVSGEGDFSLPKLPNLRGLNLYDASFGGDGLENIPSIEVLDLSGTSVGDESVPVLVTLTKLRILVLGGTNISDSGREQLHRALPNCEILDVMYERSTSF